MIVRSIYARTRNRSRYLLHRLPFCTSPDSSVTRLDSKDKATELAPRKKKRVVFDASRFRQPESVQAEPTSFPYLYRDPDEDYYRRRFYPKLKETQDDLDDEKGLGGWRRRGVEGNYGRSFRESSRSRDSFIARYGVEALRPAAKHRPFWETQDAGDLDDEKYFDEKEYIYEPIKPRSNKNVPKSMNSLVKSLCKFAREGNHFLAAEILDEGAKCDKFDDRLWTPLHYASSRGHHPIVKLFLMKDPDVNIKDYDGVSPLMAAASNGQFKACQLLIQHKCGLEFRDGFDRTALLLAMAGRHHRVACLLIDSGANIEARDKDGWAPLHYCCFYGPFYTVQPLLDANAKINLQDFEGNTPLHLSAAAGSYDSCTALLKHGADRHIKNHNGYIPAHVAVHWAQIDCLQALLQSPDDLLQLNKQGETLKEMATRSGFKRLLGALEAFESNPQETSAPKAGTSALVSADEAVALEVVTFRVGGRTFITSKSTLEVIYGSYFWMMLHPEKGLPILNESNRPDLGPGPGPELQRLSETEFQLDRDPNLFSYILELLRGLKYANLKEVVLPEDKYVLGMLLDEAKFFRLTKIVEALKANRRTRQEKSYRNVMTEKQRRKMVSVGLSTPLLSDYGKSYQPPSIEHAQGNDQFRQWDPLKDPFAKKLPNLPKVMPKRRKLR